MDTIHPQVPVLWFECDEELADLITLMNICGIPTLLSSQDNRLNHGTVRRVWVEIEGQWLLPFLGLLDMPEETGDVESLSNRIAVDWEPTEDWIAFREELPWHYKYM